MQDKVNFGFKKVFKDQKYKLVKEVFDSVAPVYDQMNDLMSLGIHRIWKNDLVKDILEHNPKNLLDVGGGTGDIAFKCIKSKDLPVTVLDINQKMLEKGIERSYNLGLFNKLQWVLGNAENLPIKSNTFDAYSIAFCIRNVTEIDKVLEESYRVLKKGGRFFCLEFSNVDNVALAKAYDLWSFSVIPNIGKLVAKNSEAYRYLAESIRKFPKAEDFRQKIIKAGFKKVSYKKLSFGVAAIHTGVKL